MIHPDTFQFLGQLAENNNRDWFQLHKNRYQAAKDDILNFTSGLISGISSFDAEVPSSVKPADCVMRIYRDVRFSKDKSPYKTNFGIAISPNAKNFNGPGYYIHIQPGKSFVAGGCWMPSSDHLKAIRQEIDYNASEFLEIAEAGDFKKEFNELSREDSLKTLPKEYDSAHELIHYLKLKSFIASRQFTDEELQQPHALRNVIGTLAKLYPLMVFLRNAIS